MNNEWEIIEYKKLDKNLELVLKNNSKILNELSELKKIISNQEDIIKLLLENHNKLHNKIEDYHKVNKNIDLIEKSENEIDENNFDLSPLNLETTNTPNLYTPNTINFLNNNSDYNYINRVTNRMWRKTPYTTTPKFFSNIFNNNS